MTRSDSFGRYLKVLLHKGSAKAPRSTDPDRDTRYCEQYVDMALRVRQPGADDSTRLAYDAAHRNMISLRDEELTRAVEEVHGLALFPWEDFTRERLHRELENFAEAARAFLGAKK